jgi:hypothetical protein
MQPRSEEFRAHTAECEELAKWYGAAIKHQYEQLARQWLFLADPSGAFTIRAASPEVREVGRHHSMVFRP